MPPHRPLPPLTELCTDQALVLLSKSLKSAAPPKERVHQRNYVMATLNANIRQHLINIIFQRPMYYQGLSCKCLLLEMLGDRSTHAVDFTKAGRAYIDQVWQFYRTITTGLMISLTRLGVACNLNKKADEKYVPDVNVTIHRAFGQMKHLRWVALVGMADRTMLACLGENCAHLEYLDVRESNRVDDEAIAGLLLKYPMDMEDMEEEDLCNEDFENIQTNACASTLRFLGISETRVSLMSVAFALHHVPNLESFGGPILEGLVSGVLGQLKPNNGCRSFQLRELWDARVLPCQASLLSMMCPRLSRLTTDASSLDSLHIVSTISALTLKLYYRDYIDDIYYYLQGSGSRLKELVLVDHIICCLDLSWLPELTPNLERLEATLSAEEGAEVAYWPRLKVAKVTVRSSKAIHALLTHALSLQDLDLTFSKEDYQETSSCIDDDLIIGAVVDGSLRDIRRLQINECALSMKALDCLLWHCPDLSYLSPVAFWKGISQQDLRALRRRIKENNWVLRIVMRVEWENNGEGLEESDGGDDLDLHDVGGA